MVKAGIGLLKWPNSDTFENFTGISLMSNDIREVPDGLEYPKLQALLLQQNSSLVLSSNCFQRMGHLNVLDMSSIRGLSLPRSLIFIAGLTTLCLDDCIFGEEVDISCIGKFTNLEILSLKGTAVVEIPKDFGKLVKLRIFYLKGCSNLKHIPQDVISCLKNLEELYVSNSYDHDGKELLVKLEVLSRHAILGIRTKKLIDRLTDSLSLCIMSSCIPFLNLTSFLIEIGFGSFTPLEMSPSRSRILFIAGIQSLDWLYQLPTQIIKSVLSLQLCEIGAMGNIVYDLINNHGFNDLKCLQLSYCGEIKYLLSTVECKPCIVFDSLESLSMKNLPTVVEICHGRAPSESFCKLKWVCISECDKMLTIVPSHLLERLGSSLEMFEARNCKLVEYVFDVERLVIVKGETKFLSSLKDLQLEGLPEMSQIWKGNANLISLCNIIRISLSACSKLRQVFPPALLPSLISLQHLEICGCDGLEEIFGIEEEGDHQENEITLKTDHTAISPGLGNLTSIKISGCHKLKNLFTPHIVKVLVQPRTLEVGCCFKMEEIVSDEKLAETESLTEKIIFPSLYRIDLGELERLTCFCAGRFTIEFPALELVVLQVCPNMETFGHGDQVTPKLNVIRLRDQECWKDNLNITVQQFFKEKQERVLVQPRRQLTRMTKSKYC